MHETVNSKRKVLKASIEISEELKKQLHDFSKRHPEMEENENKHALIVKPICYGIA